MPSATPPSIADLVQHRVRSSGPYPFLTFYSDVTDERTELSHATFANWVTKTANLLVEECDAGPGTQVALALGSHWTTAVIAFACWHAGAEAVLVNPREPERTPAGVQAVFVQEEAISGGAAPGDGVPVIVVGAGLGGRLAGTPLQPGWLPYGEEVLAFGDEYDGPEARTDRGALVVTATGGAPVRLTQANLLAAADAVTAWGLSADDRLLVLRDPQFVDGLVLGLLAPYLAGGSAVLVADPIPGGLWRKAVDERCTRVLLDAGALDALPPPGRAHDVTHLVCPGGAAPAVAAEAEVRTGIGVHRGHGLVAAATASTLEPADAGPETRRWRGDVAGTSVGCATSRAEVMVAAPDGRPVPPGEQGEILVRGDVVSPDAGEWLRSGDRGFLQRGPDGRDWVFLTGRVR